MGEIVPIGGFLHFFLEKTIMEKSSESAFFDDCDYYCDDNYEDFYQAEIERQEAQHIEMEELEKTRIKLEKLNGQKLEFISIIEEFDEEPSLKGPPVPTILLKDISILETGEIIADSLYFAKGNSWKNCKVGDQVSFEARVVYYPMSLDYRLEMPNKVSVLEKNCQQAIK